MFLQSKKPSSRQYLHFLDKTGLSVSICQLRWYTPVFNRCFLRIGQWRPSFLRLWFTAGVFVALVMMLLSVFLLCLHIHKCFCVDTLVYMSTSMHQSTHKLHPLKISLNICVQFVRWPYVCDINQPSLLTPFNSVLVSVSVFMAISTVFHSINSPDNSLFSHSVLPVIYLPYWSFQLYVSS